MSLGDQFLDSTGALSCVVKLQLLFVVFALPWVAALVIRQPERATVEGEPGGSASSGRTRLRRPEGQAALRSERTL
jgi:hypothetical protein